MCMGLLLVCVCAPYAYVFRACGDQESLELELQMVVSCMWVLRPEPGPLPPSRTESSLNY